MSAFEVTPTQYGLRIAYKGFPDPREVAEMTTTMQRILPTLPPGWGILVDMLDNKAFSAESAALMEGQVTLCRQHGLVRAAVVLQGAIIALQARRIAAAGGALDVIRFFDAGADPDWEKRAVAWITLGIEPGK